MLLNYIGEKIFLHGLFFIKSPRADSITAGILAICMRWNCLLSLECICSVTSSEADIWDSILLSSSVVQKTILNNSTIFRVLISMKSWWKLFDRGQGNGVRGDLSGAFPIKIGESPSDGVRGKAEAAVLTSRWRRELFSRGRWSASWPYLPVAPIENPQRSTAALAVLPNRHGHIQLEIRRDPWKA